MFTTLSKSAIWPATAIVLAIIGAAAYLCSQGDLPGGDVLTLLVSILTAVGGVTAAHVTGTAVANANTATTPPGVAVQVPAATTGAVVAAGPAMPTGPGVPV